MDVRSVELRDLNNVGSERTFRDCERIVLTIYKRFNDGSIIVMKVTKNKTILAMMGIKSDGSLLYDVESKIILDEDKVEDFEVLQEGEDESTLSYYKIDSFFSEVTKKCVYVRA